MKIQTLPQSEFTTFRPSRERQLNDRLIMENSIFAAIAYFEKNKKDEIQEEKEKLEAIVSGALKPLAEKEPKGKIYKKLPLLTRSAKFAPSALLETF